MESSCVPAFPISTGNTLVRGVLHPVPLALSEVRKLCQIEQTRVGAHFECVRCPTREPILRNHPADPEPSASGTLRVTTAAGIQEDSPPTLRRLDLAYPLWERLSPTVVIRRRPKRMQGLRLPCPGLGNF